MRLIRCRCLFLQLDAAFDLSGRWRLNAPEKLTVEAAEAREALNREKTGPSALFRDPGSRSLVLSW